MFGRENENIFGFALESCFLFLVCYVIVAVDIENEHHFDGSALEISPNWQKSKAGFDCKIYLFGVLVGSKITANLYIEEKKYVSVKK